MDIGKQVKQKADSLNTQSENLGRRRRLRWQKKEYNTHFSYTKEEKNGSIKSCGAAFVAVNMQANICYLLK